MYLLDTNICIYLIKQKPIQVLNYFQEIRPGEIAISSITLSELQFGVEKSDYQEKNRQALEKFVTPLQIFNYDSAASSVYGKIRKHISINARLVTNNEKEFSRIPNLLVENWITQDNT